MRGDSGPEGCEAAGPARRRLPCHSGCPRVPGGRPWEAAGWPSGRWGPAGFPPRRCGWGGCTQGKAAGGVGRGTVGPALPHLGSPAHR